MSDTGLAAAQDKMRAGGVQPTAIEVFSHHYRELKAGATGLVAEADIAPLGQPQRLADLEVEQEAGRAALDATVVIKLNGGLGTSMGMEAAKTLLPVRGELTFLDVIVQQVLHARRTLGVRLPIIFMNSFSTRDDTVQALAAYPDLAVDELPLDFLQNREPKLRADDLTPVGWPPDETLEWCPPGHGDIYTALAGSGLLDDLMEAGLRHAFLSNGDNLGATPDPQVAGWFASSGLPFASEVCRRTPADRKGGHLATRTSDGRLVLRDSAQTAPEDEAAFADIARHRYFNCNNLWIDLQVLSELLRKRSGVLGLPLIRNAKTVDPRDSSSPAVIQIETAMGAAVEVFEGAQALEVDRGRFLPVKSTNDLLTMRSDAYELGEDCAIRLCAGLETAPYVDLDPAYYKLLADFDHRFPDGPPSLVETSSLTVRGDWTFRADARVRGTVSIDAEGSPGTLGAHSPQLEQTG